MKRSERRHLKQNELVTSVARLQETFQAQRRTIIGGAVAALVVVLAAVGFFVWRSESQARAQAMLADALATLEAPVVPPSPAPSPAPTTPAAAPTPATPATPATPPPGSYPSEKAKLEAAVPKLMAAANAHPSADAGIAARYHAAATLASLGRAAEAEQRYREVIDRAGNGLYGQMARLGLAAVQIQAKRYDEAITAIKEISSKPDGELPQDALLMQLGRAYAAAGRRTDAIQTYKRIVQEFPQSLYLTDARREVEALEASSKPAA